MLCSALPRLIERHRAVQQPLVVRLVLDQRPGRRGGVLRPPVRHAVDAPVALLQRHVTVPRLAAPRRDRVVPAVVQRGGALERVELLGNTRPLEKKSYATALRCDAMVCGARPAQLREACPAGEYLARPAGFLDDGNALEVQAFDHRSPQRSFSRKISK